MWDNNDNNHNNQQDDFVMSQNNQREGFGSNTNNSSRYFGHRNDTLVGQGYQWNDSEDDKGQSSGLGFGNVHQSYDQRFNIARISQSNPTQTQTQPQAQEHTRMDSVNAQSAYDYELRMANEQIATGEEQEPIAKENVIEQKPITLKQRLREIEQKRIQTNIEVKNKVKEAEEQLKEAKMQAKEEQKAAKALAKEEKKQAKLQAKLDKQNAKEQKKLEKSASKNIDNTYDDFQDMNEYHEPVNNRAEDIEMLGFEDNTVQQQYVSPQNNTQRSYSDPNVQTVLVGFPPKEEMTRRQRKIAKKASRFDEMDLRNYPMTVGKWIGTFIVLAIPLINVIAFICWFFGVGNKSRTSWIRSFVVIALIITIILGALLGAGYFLIAQKVEAETGEPATLNGVLVYIVNSVCDLLSGVVGEETIEPIREQIIGMLGGSNQTEDNTDTPAN